MPPRPSKEDVLTAYRRSALLDAAVRVFGAYGFERATMEQIAREADVAKGTIYLYYESKQAIYEAALRNGFSGLDALTRRRLDEAKTLREAIMSFIATRAGYFAEHPDFFRMYVAAVVMQIISVDTGPADVQAMVEEQVRHLEQVVERAIARREIRRVDAAATARGIFDLTRGLVARRLTTGADPDVTADADFLADLIWRGLRREGSPSRVAAPRRPDAKGRAHKTRGRK